MMNRLSFFKSTFFWGSCVVALAALGSLPALAQDQGGAFYNGKPGVNLDPSLVGQTGFDVYGPNLKNTAFQALSNVSLTLEVVKNTGNASFKFGTFAYDDNPADPNVNWSKDYGYPKPLKPQYVDAASFAETSSTQAGGIGATSINQVSAGQLVGVWVEIDGQTTLYSLNTLNENDSSSYAYTQLGEGKSDSSPQWNDVTLFFNPSGANTSGYQNSPIAINLTVGPAAAASSGAPLPGVWASLALAGVLSTYLQGRKRK